MADECGTMTVSLSISRWRLLVMRLWIWALVVSEKTLPGSVDRDGEAQRMLAFAVRGCKVRVVQ